jgi:methylenetetrahydrofolate dehydrogenase (NADP+)/methenyltetrahydrofolate cyclohydrolase
MSKLINGKEISEYIKNNVKNEVEFLKKQGVSVGLAVIIVGDNPASKVYVSNKEKACEALGIKSFKYALDESTTNEQLLELIDKLNADDEVDGILCQLPLPRHLDEKIIIDRILPSKDVDAFHAQNVGKIMIGDFDFLPCTPAGVIEMLKYENIDITSKNCVVIGRSNIVGKPMAMLLLHNNATVTVCHSKTKNLAEICRKADILVVAIGRAKFVTADMVKEGAVVIDVGMNRDENGKLCGDVDFDSVKDIASAITPVPGGVGPMTIAMLMQNTLTAAKLKKAR